MSKIIIIVVFIFWAAFSVFYASSLLHKPNLNSNQQNTSNTNTTNTVSDLGSQLTAHRQSSDCWLAIQGKIYDVTSYISSHPGGANEIIKYCGQDATQAFSSKDKNIPQDHSSNAYNLLKNYYLGDLYVAAVNNNTINANNANTNTTNQPAATNQATTVSYPLTTALVAQHNQANDCWVTAGNNVYNVTSYIRSHPGGQANITRYCGADMAAAYTAQGHSANANQIFASYKIGTIGSTISTPITNTPPTNNTTNNPGPSDDDEEDD